MFIDTRLRKRTAGLTYGITAVVSLVLGGVYAFKQSFMPYHADALSRSWGEVEAANQVLISALMTVSGGGWFTIGYGSRVIEHHLRDDQPNIVEETAAETGGTG